MSNQQIMAKITILKGGIDLHLKLDIFHSKLILCHIIV